MASPKLTDNPSCIPSVMDALSTDMDDDVVQEIQRYFDALTKPSARNPYQNAHILWRFMAALRATDNKNALDLYNRILSQSYRNDNTLIQLIGYNWNRAYAMNDWEKLIIGNIPSTLAPKQTRQEAYLAYLMPALQRYWKSPQSLSTIEISLLPFAFWPSAIVERNIRKYRERSYLGLVLDDEEVTQSLRALTKQYGSRWQTEAHLHAQFFWHSDASQPFDCKSFYHARGKLLSWESFKKWEQTFIQDDSNKCSYAQRNVLPLIWKTFNGDEAELATLKEVIQPLIEEEQKKADDPFGLFFFFDYSCLADILRILECDMHVFREFLYWVDTFVSKEKSKDPDLTIMPTAKDLAPLWKTFKGNKEKLEEVQIWAEPITRDFTGYDKAYILNTLLPFWKKSQCTKKDIRAFSNWTTALTENMNQEQKKILFPYFVHVWTTSQNNIAQCESSLKAFILWFETLSQSIDPQHKDVFFRDTFHVWGLFKENQKDFVAFWDWAGFITKAPIDTQNIQFVYSLAKAWMGLKNKPDLCNLFNQFGQKIVQSSENKEEISLPMLYSYLASAGEVIGWNMEDWIAFHDWFTPYLTIVPITSPPDMKELAHLWKNHKPIENPVGQRAFTEEEELDWLHARWGRVVYKDTLNNFSMFPYWIRDALSRLGDSKFYQDNKTLIQLYKIWNQNMQGDFLDYLKNTRLFSDKICFSDQFRKKWLPAYCRRDYLPVIRAQWTWQIEDAYAWHHQRPPLFIQPLLEEMFVGKYIPFIVINNGARALMAREGVNAHSLEDIYKRDYNRLARQTNEASLALGTREIVLYESQNTRTHTTNKEVEDFLSYVQTLPDKEQNIIHQILGLKPKTGGNDFGAYLGFCMYYPAQPNTPNGDELLGRVWACIKKNAHEKGQKKYLETLASQEMKNKPQEEITKEANEAGKKEERTILRSVPQALMNAVDYEDGVAYINCQSRITGELMKCVCWYVKDSELLPTIASNDDDDPTNEEANIRNQLARAGITADGIYKEINDPLSGQGPNFKALGIVEKGKAELWRTYNALYADFYEWKYNKLVIRDKETNKILTITTYDDVEEIMNDIDQDATLEFEDPKRDENICLRDPQTGNLVQPYNPNGTKRAVPIVRWTQEVFTAIEHEFFKIIRDKHEMQRGQEQD